MGVKKKKKTRTATQLCAKLASKLMWNNHFNVNLCHTYKWRRILNHCDIDGISYCRILLLTNTCTCTNVTTFSVENRLLGNEKSGRGFALSDADTLPQSSKASLFWIFALFFDTSFQSARLNFSHWNNTEKMERSVCLKPVSRKPWRLHTLWRFTFTAYFSWLILQNFITSSFRNHYDSSYLQDSSITDHQEDKTILYDYATLGCPVRKYYGDTFKPIIDM